METAAHCRCDQHTACCVENGDPIMGSKRLGILVASLDVAEVRDQRLAALGLLQFHQGATSELKGPFGSGPLLSQI